MSDENTLDLWVENRFAGQLHRGRGNGVEFVYSEDYLAERTPPVSIAIAKDRVAHGPDTVTPWIENLVPEGDDTRAAWASHFGEHRTDAFTLLRHMGADAPGAVQIVPEGTEPETVGGYEELSDDEIARRIRGIQESDQAWAPSADEAIHFSLAGQQSKFALARIEERWFEPSGPAPSTHIVKPGMQGTKNLGFDDQVAEFITMRAAKKLGLRVADVDILPFGDTYAFVTTRYDRLVTTDGNVKRIHQEDLCQALSIFPQKKYESDGGPSVADAVALLSANSTNFEADRTSFSNALAFNLVAGGIDGHGKNYSILLVGNQVRLAPFYDLISAYAVYPDSTVHFRGKMGMKYGKEYRIRGIDGRNAARTADVLGISRTDFLGTVRAIGERLPELFAEALSEIPDIPISDRIKRLPETIGASVEPTIGAMTADALTVARWTQPAANASQTSRVGQVWVSGHHRDGTWIEGHWRSRPRA